MRKPILIVVMVAALLLMLVPAVAQAHGGRVVRPAPFQGPFTFFWHPFFYPGPFVWGYPGGFNFAFPGPFMSSEREPYTYGYPGPYIYGTTSYVWPSCRMRQDGMWLCS